LDFLPFDWYAGGGQVKAGGVIGEIAQETRIGVCPIDRTAQFVQGAGDELTERLRRRLGHLLDEIESGADCSVVRARPNRLNPAS
jgi:hypothetical protein